MSTQPCNCSDATACEALPPVNEGSRLVVLNDADCQRVLVPLPGAVLYTDGTTVYYADGGASRPLSLPGLVPFSGIEGAEVPKLVFQTNGGVIGGMTADPSVDNLFIFSLGGVWHVGPLPVVTSFPVGNIPEECCCPAAFAVLVLDDAEENYVIKSFNPCTDATSVDSGPILTCEDGCMRKLAGTSDDQVPVWDNADEVWVPTEISSLIPTPDSVLDVSYFTISESGDEGDVPSPYSPYQYFIGTINPWSLTQSATLLSSTAIALPYSHQGLRVLNAGWYKFDLTITGSIIISGSAGTLDLNDYLGSITVNFTGFSPDPAPSGVAAMISVVDGGGFDSNIRITASLSIAANLTANTDIGMLITTVLRDATNLDGVETVGNFTYKVHGTATRIT